MFESGVLHGRLEHGGRHPIYDELEGLCRKKTVSSFLNGFREGPSRKTATYLFARYMRWRRAKDLQADPDIIVKECLDGTNRTLVQHLQVLKEYCEGDEFRDTDHETRKKHYRTMRSFYEINMVSLPRSKLRNGEEREIREVRTEPTATEFLELAKRVLSSGKLFVRDRSIIFTMLQSGMDDSTLARVFNFVGFPQLVRHFRTEDWRNWDLQKSPVRILLVRPKTNFDFFTFLDVDAVEALQEWLDMRIRLTGTKIAIHPSSNPQTLPRSDPIYISRYGDPITPGVVSAVFRESGKRAGVNIPPAERPSIFRGARIRYPWHSHECRDTIVTLARRVGADVAVGNFIVGHSIDKLRYDKSPWDVPEHFAAEYLKISRPYLNLVSGKALQVKEEMGSNLEQRLMLIERHLSEVLARPSS